MKIQWDEPLVAMTGVFVAILTVTVTVSRFLFDVTSRKVELREKIEIQLHSARMEDYPKIMDSLKVLSFERHRARPIYEREKDYLLPTNELQQLHEELNGFIYGRPGLTMTHYSREYLVWLTKEIELYQNTEDRAKRIRMISWKLHQLLRADLGLRQANLKSADADLRPNNPQDRMTIREIKERFDQFVHNDWHDEIINGTSRKNSMRD